MAERKSFLLRVEGSLFEEIRRWAAAELRSVNGQIEFVLRRAVDERRRGARPAPPAGGDPEKPAA